MEYRLQQLLRSMEYRLQQLPTSRVFITLKVCKCSFHLNTIEPLILKGTQPNLVEIPISIKISTSVLREATALHFTNQNCHETFHWAPWRIQ